MRILGDASKDIEKKKICKNCGTIIGYLPIDVKEHIAKDYGGGSDLIRYIKCPKCSVTIEL